MHKVKLSIPLGQRDLVRKLAALSENDAETLRATLESASPTDSPLKLEAAVESRLTALRVDPLTFVNMLVGIRSVVDSHSASVTEVAASIADDAKERGLIPESSSRETLQNRLELLLQ